MRQGTSVRAGSFWYEGPDLETGWHAHDLHQIEYALRGYAEVETSEHRFLLPPQQAIWIPAGVSHRTALRGVHSIAVFFRPELAPGAPERPRVLAAAPVLREMMVYARRWPIARADADPVSDAFFEALALLSCEWARNEVPLCLPNSADPVIEAAMGATQADLRGAALEDVCRAIGVSERTLRRRFRAATGTSWRDYLRASRLLRAAALLVDPRHSVLDAADAVGFESPSAFARAFAERFGETPSAYRRRVGGGGEGDPE